MTPPKKLSAHWLQTPELQALFRAFANAGSQARVVGGAVRNTLLGLPVTDFDIATPSRPEDTIAIAQRHGFAAHPTGIAHGTVTLVINGQTFEVTTLRSDVETDGRRATVAFTNDWAQDAARRDFTINALYCTADGDILDPTGGLQDIPARRVRFIGSAETRIREDYLRILRFYRFNAQYSDGAPDAVSRAACVALKDGLATLSAERIQAELFKLIVAPRAVAILKEIQCDGILTRILPTTIDIQRLASLAVLEAQTGRTPDAPRRLAALATSTPEDARTLARHLKLSNADDHTMRDALRLAQVITPDLSDTEITSLLYRHGKQTSANAAMLAATRNAASTDRWANVVRTIDQRPVPLCPVNGADVIALGINEGPRIGEILQLFEAEWLSQGADQNREKALAQLAKIAAHTNQAKR